MKSFAAAFLLALLPVFAAKAQDNVIDEVIWVVGDEAILKSEVEEERMNALYEGIQIDGDPYCVIPERLAIKKLFLHQAELDSIEVTETEVIQMVDARINWMIQQLGSQEQMERYFNKTLTQIKEKLKQNIREGRIFQR